MVGKNGSSAQAARNGNGKHEVKAEVEMITPEKAREYLTRNIHNRRMRWNEVKRNSLAMERGEWLLNGEAIVFDWNDILVDGQHRLASVIESGVSIWSIVVRGVDPSAYATFDQGLKRNYSDALFTEGATNTAARAAMIRVALVYELSDPEGNFSTINNYKATVTELSQYHKLHPEADGFADHPLFCACRHAGMNTTFAGLLCYAFIRTGRMDMSERFFGIIAGDIEARADHPARALLNKLIKAKLERKYITQSEMIALCVRAFNAYISRRPLQRLFGDFGDVTPAFSGWPRGLLRSKRELLLA